jgi:alkylated DNA repair dioxygenase AlkB
MQCALFGTGAPAFDAGLPCMQRRVLSGGAWVEHHPGWLEGHERVFEQLREQTQWQSHRRQMYEREVQVPRLVARAPEEGPLAELLLRLSATLTRRYQRSLKGMALHGDKLGRLATDTIVATVSVGAPRRLLLKPNAGGPSLTFDLGWGDLFVMGGSCQRTWQHAVPKRRHADPRISIIFRPPLAER